MWPNPTTPWTAGGKPFWAREAGAQAKRYWGTVTGWPRLDPSEVGIERTSCASSP